MRTHTHNQIKCAVRMELATAVVAGQCRHHHHPFPSHPINSKRFSHWIVRNYSNFGMHKTIKSNNHLFLAFHSIKLSFKLNQIFNRWWMSFYSISILKLIQLINNNNNEKTLVWVVEFVGNKSIATFSIKSEKIIEKVTSEILHPILVKENTFLLTYVDFFLISIPNISRNTCVVRTVAYVWMTA